MTLLLEEGILRVQLRLVAPSSQFGSSSGRATAGELLRWPQEPRIQRLWFRNGSPESQTWYRPILSCSRVLCLVPSLIEVENMTNKPNKTQTSYKLLTTGNGSTICQSMLVPSSGGIRSQLKAQKWLVDASRFFVPD